MSESSALAVVMVFDPRKSGTSMGSDARMWGGVFSFCLKKLIVREMEGGQKSIQGRVWHLREKTFWIF